MEVKTYRAKTMRDALRLIREDLGPDASVLQTREVRGGVFRWLLGPRQIEVTASADVLVPSRLPTSVHARQAKGRKQSPGAQSVREPTRRPRHASPLASHEMASHEMAPHAQAAQPLAEHLDYRQKFARELRGQSSDAYSMIEALCGTAVPIRRANSAALDAIESELLGADVCPAEARALIDRVAAGLSPAQQDDPRFLRERLLHTVEEDIDTSGPIRVDSARTRLIALVGPTGVGKTTTIAKLAANFHLRQRLRIGLITVDTYRIAAVEQLRTYAEIIDLPMEVVSTPPEVRKALDRLAGLDLILMDTAGRSPHDDGQIQELKSMLCAANPDEVHLVLSGVAGGSNLQKTAQRFANVGATSLILTKLDEAAGLGNLLSLLRGCRIPLSYLTDGQNVPDDIQVADRRHVARAILGMTQHA